MSSLRVSGTIPWPKRTFGADWYRASITLDDAGTFALVRYFDVGNALRGGLLWDLQKQSLLAGEYLDAHPTVGRAVRRGEGGTEVVDLASAQVVGRVDGRLDLALSPDGAFVVQRPRPDADKKLVRAQTLVQRIDGGKAKELATSSVAEAFVDGNRLASVSARGAISLWDLDSGKTVGKLPGLGKPASIRVSPDGKRVALSAFDGQYAVFDLGSPTPVAQGSSMIVFQDDARFDGTRFVGTNVLLDVMSGASKSHEDGWLKGRRPSGRGQTALIAHPNVAVVTERDILGNPVVELWNVETAEKLASVEVASRADAIAFSAGTLVVAHLPADDADGPALTLLGLGTVPAPEETRKETRPRTRP